MKPYLTFSVDEPGTISAQRWMNGLAQCSALTSHLGVKIKASREEVQQPYILAGLQCLTTFCCQCISLIMWDDQCTSHHPQMSYSSRLYIPPAHLTYWTMFC